MCWGTWILLFLWISFGTVNKASNASEQLIWRKGHTSPLHLANSYNLRSNASSDLAGLDEGILSLGLGLQLGTFWLELLDLPCDPLQLFLDLLVFPLSLLDLILHYYIKTDQRTRLEDRGGRCMELSNRCCCYLITTEVSYLPFFHLLIKFLCRFSVWLQFLLQWLQLLLHLNHLQHLSQ